MFKKAKYLEMRGVLSSNHNKNNLLYGNKVLNF